MIGFSRIAALSIVLTMTLVGHARAANVLALSSVAREYGFVYTTESTEVAAHLSRPGVSILVRAGDPRYEVNDDVQYLVRPPVFEDNQIYVDSSLEPVLAHLAEAHPWPGSSNVPPVAAPFTAAPGAVITIAVHYLDATQTIAAAGTAPPGAPVEVAVKALISRDIPAVTVARATAYAGPDGTYNALLSVVSMTFRNTVLQFVASAGPGVKPADTLIDLGPPIPHLVSPNDRLPDN